MHPLEGWMRISILPICFQISESPICRYVNSIPRMDRSNAKPVPPGEPLPQSPEALWGVQTLCAAAGGGETCGRGHGRISGGAAMAWWGSCWGFFSWKIEDFWEVNIYYKHMIYNICNIIYVIEDWTTTWTSTFFSQQKGMMLWNDWTYWQARHCHIQKIEKWPFTEDTYH